MIYPNIDNLLRRYKLVLASGSPRRVGILRNCGIPFRQITPDIEENNNSELNPSQLAIILAEQKAKAVRNLINDKEIALGGDTIVILHGKVLGKPVSPTNATEMLTALSGNMHTVCSAIALLDGRDRLFSDCELTDVYFHDVSLNEIINYVKSGVPLDKAGAYGIQELGGFLVDRIEGNIDNVTGLPMTLLDKLAAKMA